MPSILLFLLSSRVNPSLYIFLNNSTEVVPFMIIGTIWFSSEILFKFEPFITATTYFILR